MIRAEILLQGGHTVTIDTKHEQIAHALGQFKSDLNGGWKDFTGHYLIHPGSVSAIRFYDTDEKPST